MQADPVQITKMLGEIRNGNQKASSELIEAVYSDLRCIARNSMSFERSDHTLQPTALVHEAFLRIFSGVEVPWRDRAHFFAVAARQMRRLLIDHGREFRAQKRGSGLKVSLDDALHLPAAGNCGVDELSDLLERLQRIDAEAAQVVEMKFLAGMTDEEVAAELGCSPSTVRRHWNFAKAWLIHQMSGASK